MTQSTFEKELRWYKGFEAPMDIDIVDRVLSAQSKALEALENELPLFPLNKHVVMELVQKHFGKGG